MMLMAMMMAAALSEDVAAQLPLPADVKPGMAIYRRDMLPPDASSGASQAAGEKKVNGYALLECHIDAHSVPDTCVVLEEKPAGHDLGKRAAFAVLNAHPDPGAGLSNIWMKLHVEAVH